MPGVVNVCILILAIVLAVVNSFIGKASRQHASALKANIIDTAASSGKFNVLVSVIKAAGLEKALSGPGPFTLFAPNDEAFAKVPKEAIDTLMSDAALLRDTLLFHVVPQKMTPTRNGRNSNTLLLDSKSTPKQLTIKIKNWAMDTYVITGQPNIPQVVTFDMKCDNGLIHEINEVLVPYSGEFAPKITFIGVGDLFGNKTIQEGYYGPQSGLDRHGNKYDGPEREYVPVTIGDDWKYSGNWETMIPETIYKAAADYEEKKKERKVYFAGWKDKMKQKQP